MRNLSLTTALTAALGATLALGGCGKADKPKATPAPVAAAKPAAAKPAAAKPAAAVPTVKAAPAPKAADEDGAAPAAEVACGAHAKAGKDAPGCPGMPAAAAVGANPAAAPAATTGAGAAAVAGKVYGKGVSAIPTVQVSALLADVDGYAGKRVRVEGIVMDVCPMRGCWFKMAGDKPGSNLRFKVRDGVMVFPMSAKGQFAVAEGVVRKIPLNLAQTKRYMAHQAEEKGEKFDVASVTKPMTIIRLDGVGAVLRDKK
ncbi:MAG: DUF4920 domain-containing protein [Myxococcales bacterium]|nr:DUF4920 domain-containing protein [Myxococcales bacterium]